MENIHLRQATINDLEVVQQIGRQTFTETFASVNTEANMNQYLQEGFAEARLTAELSNPHSSFYLAELYSQVIGYLKLNFGPSQTELKEDTAVEIERIYVLQAFHGKKVGQLLYEKALQIAKQSNVDYIWLGVWEENARALQFYKKNGFVAFDKHLFKLGNEEQTDIMMKLLLRER